MRMAMASPAAHLAVAGRTVRLTSLYAAAQRRARCSAWLLPALALVLPGCRPEPPGSRDAPAAAGGAGGTVQALLLELDRVDARVSEVDAIFQPLPLLRPAQEAELRQFGNAQQLGAARRLGVEPNSSEAELQRLVREGALVQLADTTQLWVVRQLDYSRPLLTPDAAALLRELAMRFHAVLQQHGAPPFRLEVTSLLRSAEDQERLRRVNPNAAAGESTHMYGTTLDVAYSAFAAPAEPIAPVDMEDAAASALLARYAAARAEAVAARRSRELQALLGGVLLEMQREGRVMVTLERLQPVYHMTVARALAER